MKALTAALILLLATLWLTAAPACAQVQPLTAWWIDTGATDSTGLGAGMAPLGDINQDGYDDFVVAATIGYGGRLYVYLGGSQPDTMPYLTIPAPASNMNWFGTWLFSVGDVNGDGYSDFIASATNQNTLPEISTDFLYLGGPLLDTIPDIAFGLDLTGMGAGLGDLNGDGFDDFALLSAQDAIYIYLGGDSLDSLPEVIIHPDSVLNRIGFHMAPLGDVNNDGYADWVMSHPQCQGAQGEAEAGVIAIYYGGNPPDTIPHFVIHGPAAGDWLGKTLTTFDWNGDGQVDIFAGSAIQYPPNYYSSAWEFNVSPTMSGQPDHAFIGEGGYLNCMGNVMFHADLNGDGRQDLIDGEPGWEIRGKVYVFLNAAYSDTLFDATYYQGHFNTALGYSGCNAGDVNNDGIEDIVVGEGYPQGYGRVHLILGDNALHQSGVEPVQPPPLPQSAALIKTYPNPFNGQVVLEISAPSLKDNTIEIYNLEGKLVRQFHLGYGQRRAVWDGKSASGLPCTSGIYLAKLTGPSCQATTKLTLIR